MLLSLSIIILGGLCFGWLASRLHLPYIVGMIAAEIVFGPYVLNLLDPSELNISSDLRKIALIIIIAKAGLTLNIDDLKRIGRPAVLLCFLPATFEMIGFVLFAPSLMHVTRLQAGILGAVMGAVSPAVTVPRLSKYIDEGYGVKKGIPQMLIAGASADDVYVIVVFTALIRLEAGGSINAMSFLQIPESIILGIAAGVVIGLLLSFWFQKVHIRDSLKLTIMMAVGMLLYWLEDALDGVIAVSGLLAVMTMGITMNHQTPVQAKRLSVRFSKLWVAAEIFLFVLVGTSVQISCVTQAGLE